MVFFLDQYILLPNTKMTLILTSRCLCVILVILVCMRTCLSDVYISIAHMKDELDKRRQDISVDALKQVLKDQEESLRKMNRLVEALEDIQTGIKQPDFDVDHPLDAYRFVRNYSLVLNKTVVDFQRELHQQDTAQGQMVEIINQLTPLPTDDLYGTIKAILRIQSTYGLQTTDIADGNIRNISRPKLSAAECEDIMAVAYNTRLTDTGREWINQALTRVMEGDTSTTYRQILSKGAAISFKNSDELEAIAIYDVLAKNDPRNRYQRYKLKFYKDNCPLKTIVVYPTMENFVSEVCLGKKQNNDKAASKGKHLLCRYVDNGHPILRYQPVKMEMISIEPYIVVYHNCINKAIISSIKTISKPKLERSMVYDEVRGTPVPSRQRTSKGFFFKDENAVEVTKLYKYIESLTSLNRDSYEDLQISNYGVGGHYMLHTDHKDTSSWTGDNRIATFMIYLCLPVCRSIPISMYINCPPQLIHLSDVKEGGATAFNNIGESIFPEEGKVVFWYNLDPSGEGDERTRHIACPVIVGEKWVANVWIHSFGQEFVRPCNLDKNDLRWNI